MGKKIVLVVNLATIVVIIVSFWAIIPKWKATLELQEDNFNTISAISDKLSNIYPNLDLNLVERISQRIGGMEDREMSCVAHGLALASAYKGDVGGADAWLEEYRLFCLRAGIEVDETKIKQVKEIALKYPLVQL